MKNIEILLDEFMIYCDSKNLSKKTMMSYEQTLQSNTPNVLIGFIKGKLGNATYAECKTFLVNLAELHKEDFAEDKIVGLLDLLDNKFGDHLNKTQINIIRLF